ncbi:GPI transamidase component PIG-T [Belonocnema kinseyi]|uniref:GPI transamidase component PIG-T n=1 Tax=Belonocnema kinseyi TaxID=2817044 RepID=UPI00143D4129|nr:GPI transamidase component PIG-T [Belonocnema kinseyi]
MRNFLYQKCSVILMLLCISRGNTFSDTFDEELMLKPLPSGFIYAFFQFTTLWEAPNTLQTLQHSHLFPRGLGEILGRHKVDELHFTLTEGLWRYKKWGYPFENAGPGAEISSWFNQNVSNVDKEWKSLTNSLAGLFCASLNFVEPLNTLSPEFSMPPTSALNHKPNSSYLRYSTLPRETACTENLTPFKKLLPCDSKKGLATLLNSAYIHNTNYHSIGIHFRSVCRNSECTKTSLELRQTVSLVYDSLAEDSQDWSIRKLFGTALRDACPLATISNIYVDITTNKTIHTYKLTPEPNAKVSSLRGGQKNMIGVYDIKSYTSKGIFNVASYYNSPNFDTKGFVPILLASRYIIGYGQQKGTLVTKLRNNHWQPLNIILFENIPWYLSLYLHTVKFTSNGKPIQPSVIRIRWILLPFKKQIIKIYRKFRYRMRCFNASREGYLVQLRTDVLLISLPTPDFSMPYNVICLACTAVALAFGPLHNISTKKLVLKKIQKTWWKNNKIFSYFAKEKTE